MRKVTFPSSAYFLLMIVLIFRKLSWLFVRNTMRDRDTIQGVFVQNRQQEIFHFE
jgi:hypothetical protein